MSLAVMTELEYVLRILAAGICGGVIGYERKNRNKAAGSKTHVIVAVSSALMIIISKYGFYDVLGEYIKLDPSRVAAGVEMCIRDRGIHCLIHQMQMSMIHRENEAVT